VADITHRIESKNIGAPDEARPFPKGRVELVKLAQGDVGRGTFEPGWRWSEHIKPLAGTETCEVHHLGYCLSGRMRVIMNDGTQVEVGPGDVVDIPPGHDAYTIGDEACVMVDFGGMAGYAQKGS
jgi:quercetin dioxygenase-like cupin family protein